MATSLLSMISMATGLQTKKKKTNERITDRSKKLTPETLTQSV